MNISTNYILNSSKVGKILEKILEEERIKILMKELREHHYDTYLHSLRVCLLALDLGIENKLGNKRLRFLAYGSLLHDIGKKKISLYLLEKRGGLTKQEKGQIEQHPRLALEEIREFDKEVVALVGSSHEFQKNPYPRKGTEEVGIERRRQGDIELGQILAVSDWYDALRSSRSYKKPKNKKETEKILRERYTGSPKYINQILKR